MSIEIRLPQWGMGMIEGRVLEWFKQEGDAVEAGEVLAEVEAAKTTEDLVAPRSGVLERILVPAGAMVPVHELLATLATGAGDGADVSGATAGEPTTAGPATAGPATAAPATAGPGQTGPAPSGPGGGAVGGARNVVPRARKLAQDLGVDLATVVGTGPGGRIVEDDVRAAASAAPERPGPPAAEGTRVPFVGMRGTIAQRTHESLRSMAQLTLVTTADVTDLVAYRAGLDRSGRPSYADFVVRAVALALREHPGLNAWVDEDGILVHDGIHVGVATALDDGLVVPVIRDADRRSLAEIAVESARLTRAVRAGEFSSQDISVGTFTVSSLGGQGIDAFTPIVNPPEVAILGVGRIVEQPVRDGDGLAWRQVVTLSLTIDHRAVDGAPGAAFLATVGELLGSPDLLAAPPS